MEPTRDFFSKLRKMAVTLEAETEKLQQAFEGRRNEDGDSGERGSNKLCCSVRTPKHVLMYLVMYICVNIGLFHFRQSRPSDASIS